MESLTPDQAQALWDAGGFLVLTDLPQGSEFGIDGTFHTVRRFSGIKFVPPGLHLITWSPPPSSYSSSSSTETDTEAYSTTGAGAGAGAGPSTIPIRHALLRQFKPRERVVLSYDPKSESVPVPLSSSSSSSSSLSLEESQNDEERTSPNVISDDHLRTLDKEMAAYPFEGLEKWKSQTNEITSDIVRTVLGGGDGRVDGLMGVEGEEEEEESGELRAIKDDLDKIQPGSDRAVVANANANVQRTKTKTKTMKFPTFDLKRSWRDGAVGEEVTRYSKDKSWLLGNVIEEQLNNDPSQIIAHLQLSFIILLHLSSYSALLTYKRLLTLLCQSSSFLSSPSEYLPDASPIKTIRRIYLSLIYTLSAQLDVLPENSFETELPEMDLLFLDQIESLRKNLALAMWGSALSTSTSTATATGTVTAGSSGWKESDREVIKTAWNRLRDVGWKKWKWDIDEIGHRVEEDDDEEEEGEYAPVVVEI